MQSKFFDKNDVSKNGFNVKAGLIPEIFFDLIGRIVPGVIALVALAVTCLGPHEAYRLMSQELDSKELLLFLIPSYFAAIVMVPVGWCLHRIGLTLLGPLREPRWPRWTHDTGDERVGSKVERYFCGFAASDSGKTPAVRLPVDRWKTQDWILGQMRCEQPGEANRLLKILAEKSLCHVLTASFSVLITINVGAAGLEFWGLNPWGILESGLVWRLVFAGLLMICVLALWKWRADLDDFLAFALASYWYHQRRGEQAQVTDPAASAS